MTNHIDLGTVLRQTLSANLYSNLVTRSTGRAVRTQIELLVSSSANRVLTVIDFAHVSMIDFSCADEVIAKLLQSFAPDREAYFVFRGMTDDHWHAVESVLERHGLALVVEADTGIELMGVLDEREQRAWQAMKRRGRAAAWELAGDMGEPEPTVRLALDRMWQRRLIMRHEGAYMPVGEIA
ncbi:MAG: hypothetical protein WD801_11685 [Gemmatimonadaceae bacterium]